MKNSIKLFFVLLLAVGVSSCMKDNPYPQYNGQAMLEIEKPLIEKYIAENSELSGMVQYKKTGIWYEILEPGVTPEIGADGKIDPSNGYYKYNINKGGSIESPRIGVEYEGKLIATGVVFEKNNTGVVDDKLFSLAGLYLGWQIAFLPSKLKDADDKEIEIAGITELGLQKGSKIRLILPSPYANEDRSSEKVPANSPLDFTIEVLKVIPPAAPAN